MTPSEASVSVTDADKRGPFPVNETKRSLGENQQSLSECFARHILAQLVDIFGVTEDQVVTSKLFEGHCREWGRVRRFRDGLEPRGPDSMCCGDPETLAPVAWQLGSAWIARVGHAYDSPHSYDTRYMLQRQLARSRLREREWPPNTDLRVRFYLFGWNSTAAPGARVHVDPGDTLFKPATVARPAGRYTIICAYGCRAQTAAVLAVTTRRNPESEVLARPDYGVGNDGAACHLRVNEHSYVTSR